MNYRTYSGCALVIKHGVALLTDDNQEDVGEDDEVDIKHYCIKISQVQKGCEVVKHISNAVSLVETDELFIQHLPHGLMHLLQKQKEIQSLTNGREILNLITKRCIL